MCELYDKYTYTKIYSFTIPAAFTYADTRVGYKDKDKRERIRIQVSNDFPQQIPEVVWWAFRIFVRKSGTRAFDIENVLKIILDTFCTKQIQRDQSPYVQLGLYPDDTIDFVRVIQVAGERTSETDSTLVEIFGRKLTV